MATIAEQLTSLANTKTAIKDAIVAKGVAVADTDPFSAYPAKIGQIESGGGAPATKFGASVDTWFGDVDENGVLQKTTWTGALNFAGVKEIGENCLQYTFHGNTGITSVDLSSVQSVKNNGLNYAFDSCTGITSVVLSSLQNVGLSGMTRAFYGCTGITGALDLSSLQSVSVSGMGYTFCNCTGITSVDLSLLQSASGYGMIQVFYGCTGITSIDLSSLQSVGADCLQSAFSGCKILNLMSFPSLTDVQANSFGTSTYTYAFRDCTALTEIHFRADMQATIEAMSGYADRWGATNATIYFDL